MAPPWTCLLLHIQSCFCSPSRSFIVLLQFFLLLACLARTSNLVAVDDSSDDRSMKDLLKITVGSEGGIANDGVLRLRRRRRRGQKKWEVNYDCQLDLFVPLKLTHSGVIIIIICLTRKGPSHPCCTHISFSSCLTTNHHNLSCKKLVHKILHHATTAKGTVVNIRRSATHS